MAAWSALFAQSAKAPTHTRPSLTLFFLLEGAFLLTLVPHVVQFPPWVSVTVIASMIIRSVIETYRWQLPSTTFCGILALCLLGGIFFQYNTVFGRDAGTAFTAGLLAIKFYELRSPRDIALIIFSCFFLVMSALLYSQALELFAYCLIMMWILTALLLRVHTGDLPQDRLLRMLGQSGIIFLQALPLALFLFFLFPRYTGKLGIKLDGSSLGLNDTVQPGSISRLSQNNAKAMYVRFLSGDIPATESMYWRALVLWQYKDGEWTTGALAGMPEREPPQPAPGSTRINQEITVSAHFQKWLFALDSPVSPIVNPAEADTWSTLFNGDILQLTSNRLEYMERYTVTSSLELADTPQKKLETDVGTQLPDDIDPRIRALADRLYLEKPTPQDYIRNVLHYFRHEGYVYSTAPGAQGKNWLPIFLFKTKVGFCEHYASAFAVLMRLENIPARLVVGYQGAEYNPYDGLYTVKQSNAHAWDEVWVDAKNQPANKHIGHWMRVDPTALLAMTEGPQNASNNPDNNDPNENQSIQRAQRPSSFSETYLPHWAQSGMQELRLRREQVEADWDNLVFSYDPETQSRLAQALGLGKGNPLGLGLACALAVGICIAIFRFLLKHRQPLPPVEKLYASFCRNMTQRGIPRALWEGPLDFTERAAEAFPDHRDSIRNIGSIVARSRYGAAPLDPAAPEQLKSLLALITASQAASSSRERT